MLLSGKRSFANRFSLIGDFSYYSKVFEMKETPELFGLDVKMVRYNNRKARPDPFEGISEVDKQK